MLCPTFNTQTLLLNLSIVMHIYLSNKAIGIRPIYCNETGREQASNPRPSSPRSGALSTVPQKNARSFQRARPGGSTSYRNVLTGQAHALSWMLGPITSDTNVMKQAGSRSRTLDLLARGPARKSMLVRQGRFPGL